jgi:hypothetical protein
MMGDNELVMVLCAGNGGIVQPRHIRVVGRPGYRAGLGVEDYVVGVIVRINIVIRISRQPADRMPLAADVNL